MPPPPSPDDRATDAPDGDVSPGAPRAHGDDLVPVSTLAADGDGSADALPEFAPGADRRAPVEPGTPPPIVGERTEDGVADGAQSSEGESLRASAPVDEPATESASAAPGPVAAGAASTTARPPRRTDDNPAESERAIIADLVHRARGLPSEPARVDAGTEVAVNAGFEVMTIGAPPSLLKRYFTTLRHASGLVMGSAVAVARDREQFAWVKGFPLFLMKVAAFFLRPLVKRGLRDQPLQVQLRRRLEMLGPTYIKLGQVLALREDLLPPFVTEELKNLLDRLPVMPFPDYLERVAKGLGRPVDEMFTFVDPKPLGSASIGQIHRARTIEGDNVILKVVKPHIYVILKRDARLLGFFGSFLQVFFARYQPKKVLDEFAEYTLREVDLRREADNAEQMAMNFADEPDIRFPRIYREYSSRLVLTMELFDGIRPDTPESTNLPLAARERVVDLGAKSIIRMLYADGFFHADLHPGNLFVLDTEPDPETGQIAPKLGFIDLGMVGFFDGDLRRTLMYYYFSLVTGDAENAARYLTSVSEIGPKGDPNGFQRAVAELCRRFYRAQRYGDVSVAQLIMESVGLAGQYRMYFPVELVLMTKALITFEGVGQTLLPGFDVAKVSQKHVNNLFLKQFHPVALVKESFRGAPELVDLIVKSPTLIAEGVRFLETQMRGGSASPLVGLRSALLSGASLVAGTIALTTGGAWFVWGPLYALAAGFAMRKG